MYVFCVDIILYFMGYIMSLKFFLSPEFYESFFKLLDYEVKQQGNVCKVKV